MRVSSIFVMKVVTRGYCDGGHVIPGLQSAESKITPTMKTMTRSPASICTREWNMLGVVFNKCTSCIGDLLSGHVREVLETERY